MKKDCFTSFPCNFSLQLNPNTLLVSTMRFLKDLRNRYRTNCTDAGKPLLFDQARQSTSLSRGRLIFRAVEDPWTFLPGADQDTRFFPNRRFERKRNEVFGLNRRNRKPSTYD